MLAPIHRIQFSMVCRTLYHAADPELRIIGRVVGARIKDQYARTVFNYGGKICGMFLLDCLYDTEYSKECAIVFDVGVKHRNALCFHEKPPSDPVTHPMHAFTTNLMLTTGCRVFGDCIISQDYSSSLTHGCISRILKTSAETYDIIITDPGNDEYMNQCAMQFYKVMYDGSKLIAPYPSSLIKKYSDINNRGVIVYTYYIYNPIARREYASQRFMIDANIIDKFRAQGFTVDTIGGAVVGPCESDDDRS